MTELLTAPPPQAMGSAPASALDPASPPGGAPPGESFADALVTAGQGPPGSAAKTDTRTADAEGAKAESDSPGPQDGNEPAAPVAAADPSVALAASLGVAAPVQPAETQAPAVAGGDATPARGDGRPVAGLQAAAPIALPAAPPAGSADGAAGAEPIAGDPRGTTTAAQQQPAAPAPVPAPAPAAVPGAALPAAGAATAAAKAGASAADPAAPGALPASGRPGTAPPAATAPAATPPDAPPAADAPAAQAPPAPQPQPDTAQAAPSPSVVPLVTARAETPAPATPVAQAPAPPPPAAPVPLNQLAHATGVAMRFTADQGGGTARILLHPQELGSVEIRLRSTPDGIIATVRAANPQAAQTLTLASDELRRSLEAQGLPVLSLDVSDGSRRQAAHDEPGASARRRADADAGTSAEDDEPMTSGPVRQPGSGSQIDVLA